MKRQSTLFFALILMAFSGYSQLNRSNYWPVAMSWGIDFSSGSPVMSSTMMQLTESSASISDTAGNLLFYTNGIEIRNANKALMPNGTGLQGCASSSQGALIVPMPQNPNIYYVFTTSCAEYNFTFGFRYSIVDMSLDNGLGDVTVKNQSIRFNVAEELAATYHANNCDFWIVTHALDSADYYSYLLTDTGLDTTPIVSTLGPTYWNIPNSNKGRSMLKFNREGTMAVQTARSTTPKVHHFDRNTGQLSAYLDIAPQAPYTDYYSSCFSPNDSVLYVTSRYYPSNTTYSFIVQYDLSQPTNQAVSASATQLFSQYGDPNLGQLQLGPDAKIYFSRYQQSHLGAIANPNVLGNGASVSQASISIGGTLVQYALPNFVSQFIGPGPNLGCAAPVGFETELATSAIKVYPNPSPGRFNFEFEQAAESNYRLQINDLMGRIVLDEKEIQSPYRFEADNLAKGIYVYALFASDKVIAKGKLNLE